MLLANALKEFGYLFENRYFTEQSTKLHLYETPFREIIFLYGP